MKKQKKKILIGSLVLVVLLLLFGNLNLLSIFQFEYDFLPYGESTNQITNLVKTGTFYGLPYPSDSKITKTEWDSKYWEIIEDTGASCRLCGSMGNINGAFSGSDLYFKFGTPMAERDGGLPVTTTLLSTEDFSERDFKASFVGNTLTSKRPGELSLNINLIGDNSINVINYQFPAGGGTNEYHVVIHPRVIDNVVEIYANGQKIKEVTIDNYKIQISSRADCGGSGGSLGWDCGTNLVMKKPSYKSQFGCTKEAGEQYYVSIFNEGNSVNLNKLDNFKKFCLSEFPVIIHTNIGATTETSILADLVNGEQFTVPTGQIWSIEYIGEMTTFGTTCEENEVYNNKEDICMARTVLSVTCPTDSTFDSEKGYCITKTLPIEFDLSTIQTHKDLENENKFIFTQTKKNDIPSQSSFLIGSDTFNSDGLSYNGNSLNINYPEDKDNWKVNFNFKGISYSGNLDDNFQLNDLLSVKIDKILGRFDEGSVEDYQINYIFLIDTSFLETEYLNGLAKVSNSYQDFNGGITLTTTNNIGTTKVEDINKQLSFGQTTFNINTENVLNVKIRPFIKVVTPEYTYTFDSEKAFAGEIKEPSIDDSTEPITEEIIEKTSKGIYYLLGFIVFLIVSIILYFKIKK